MAIDVTAEVHIDRPPEGIAAFAMEAENDTRWIGGIREVRRLTPGPTAVGTRVERVASFMGRRIEYLMEVAELEAGRRMILRSIKAPFPMKAYNFEEEDGGGTRASVRVEGGPGGFYKLAAGLMALAVRRNLTGDLKRLRGIMESGGS
jgi:hypothetical protein